MSKSHLSDHTAAPQGNDTEHRHQHDSNITIKVRQPALISSEGRLTN